MEELSIRRAGGDELPQIIAMQTEIFCGEQEIPAELIGAFLSERPVCWVAEQDGRIVASVSAWEEKDGVHLGRFVVLPPLRGRRIGTRLLGHALRELFDGGVECIRAEARDSAARMLRAVGGRDTGEPFPFYRGSVTPMLLEKEAFLRNTRQSDRKG